MSAIGLLGCGAALPQQVRTNDDPLFDTLRQKAQQDTSPRAETSLFKGIERRHYLTEDESLADLVTHACLDALSHAHLETQQIDRLYGYLSVAEYLAPNALFAVHAALALPTHCWVLPINSEYTNFLAGLILARESIMAGHSTYGLVACGLDWTRHMDYTQGHALSIGDGAGAAVVGRGATYEILDYHVETLSHKYGAMTMATRPNQPANTYGSRTYYRIDPDVGIDSLIDDGMNGPVRSINALLSKHHIQAAHTAMLCYQASRSLLDYWQQELKPARMLDTLADNGNMVFATLPVNLAHFIDELDEPYVILSSLGVGYHQTAVLLKRVC